MTILWSKLPLWRVAKKGNSFLVKIANTIETTFPVTIFRGDAVEFDVYYTQNERQIGYELRIVGQPKVNRSLWYVWVCDKVAESTTIKVLYQDYNIRLLQFEGPSYLLVMRWEVKEKSS